MNVRVHLWLRAEVKPGERRTPVTPEYAKKLVQAGFKVDVEQSPARIFPDEDYVNAGCSLVPYNSWKSLAPLEAIIIGLKELDYNEEFPLKHTHIYFAHCYKYQDGWEKILSRFKDGGGLLYDLEYLKDETGRRIAAYGYYAGVCGAALALGVWAYRNTPPGGKPYGVPQNLNGEEQLISITKNAMSATNLSPPKVIVIGFKGRSGSGAKKTLESVGIPKENITLWDKEETTGKEPQPFILEHNVLINCVHLGPGTFPFITKDLIESTKNMKLEVISDVSCDPNNPLNPLPIYNTLTTLESPVATVNIGDKGIDIIAIDNLPTILPANSSDKFCHELYPHLLNLPDKDKDYVWKTARREYIENLKKLEKTTA